MNIIVLSVDCAGADMMPSNENEEGDRLRRLLSK